MNEPRDRPSRRFLDLRTNNTLAFRVWPTQIVKRNEALAHWATMWANIVSGDLWNMANKNSGNRPQFATTTFVNMKLTDEQAKSFRSWLKAHDADLPSEMAIIMTDNGRMSVNWDNQNACFIAALTNKDDKSENLDHCVTSRSEDWYEAMAMTCYKVGVLLKDKKWSEASTNSNWG